MMKHSLNFKILPLLLLTMTGLPLKALPIDSEPLSVDIMPFLSEDTIKTAGFMDEDAAQGAQDWWESYAPLLKTGQQIGMFNNITDASNISDSKNGYQRLVEKIDPTITSQDLLHITLLFKKSNQSSADRASSINNAFTNYMSIDALLHDRDDAPQAEELSAWWKTNAAIFTSLKENSMFSQLNSGPMTSRDMRFLTEYVADKGIVPAQLTAISSAINSTILSSHTLIMREHYVEGLVTASIPSILGNRKMISSLRKAGITLAQITAAIPYLDPYQMTSVPYVLSVIKLFDDLNSGGFLANLSSGAMDASMKKSLLELLRPFAENLYFDEIPAEGLSAHSFDQRVLFLLLGAALSTKQILYTNYAPSTGMLSTQQRATLINEMITSGMTSSLIDYLENSTLSNPGFSASYEESTNASSRIDFALKVGVSQLKVEFGLLPDELYFSSSAIMSAYAHLREKNAFSNLNLTQVKDIITNFKAIDSWANREALLSPLSGQDIATALSFAQNGENRPVFDTAYADKMMLGMNNWSEIELMLSDYRQVSSQNWTTLSLLAAGHDAQLSTNKRALLTDFVINKHRWSSFESIFGLNQLSALKGKITNWSSISTVLDKEENLRSWSSLTSLTSLMNSSDDKSAAKIWAATDLHQGYFDTLFSAGILTGVTTWSALSAITTAYERLSTLTAPWTPFLSKITTTSSGTLAEAKRAAIVYFGDSQLGDKRRTAYAFIASDLTEWTSIQTSVTNYVTADRDAPQVVALAATLAKKREMLASYLLDVNKSRFAALSTAGAFGGLSTETAWTTTVSFVLANYAANASWDSLSAMLTQVTSAADKRMALAYFNPLTSATDRKTAYQNVSQQSTDFISDLHVWSDILSVLTKALAAPVDTLSIAKLTTTPTIRRDLLRSYDVDVNKSRFGAVVIAGLLDGVVLGSWTNTARMLSLYSSLANTNWANFSKKIASFESRDAKQTALVYFIDSTDSASNRVGYDRFASDLTTFSTAKMTIDKYVSIISAPTSWSLASTTLLGLTALNDRRLALDWATLSSANRTLFSAASTAGLLSGLTIWEGSNNLLDVVTQYNTVNTISTWNSNLTTIFGKVTTAQEKRAALSYLSDSVNGVAQRAAYVTNAPILANFTSWTTSSGMSAFLDAYITITSTLNPVQITNLNTLLASGFSSSTLTPTPAQKIAVLTWYQADTNRSLFNASMAITGLFNAVTDLGVVPITGKNINGYQRFVDYLSSSGTRASDIKVTTALLAAINTVSQTAVARATALKANLQAR